MIRRARERERERERERNPLNIYLSLQKDLFLAPKFFILRSTKVLGHLLNKQAIRKIGLLTALVLETSFFIMFRKNFG